MGTMSELRETKRQILQGIVELTDMRKGSVVEQYVEAKRKDGRLVRRGPYFLYSYKDKGKTISRRLLNPLAAEICREEIREFRKFEQLCEELADVSQRICDRKQAEDQSESDGPKKKRRSTSRKKSKERSSR